MLFIINTKINRLLNLKILAGRYGGHQEKYRATQKYRVIDTLTALLGSCRRWLAYNNPNAYSWHEPV